MKSLIKIVIMKKQSQIITIILAVMMFYACGGGATQKTGTGTDLLQVNNDKIGDESSKELMETDSMFEQSELQQANDPVQLKKYVNWDMPLYTISEKGDTIEKWVYNGKGLLIKHIGEYCNEDFKYDYNNFTKTTINNNNGKTLTETYTDDSFTCLAVSSNGVKYEYYPNNVLKSETASDGSVTTYNYNERGDISRIVLESDFFTIEYENEYGDSCIVSESDSFIIEYKYEYDDKGRITSVEVEEDDLIRTYRYTYEANGTITEKNYFACVEIDPMGRIISMYTFGSEGDEDTYEYENNCCKKSNLQRYEMSYSDDEDEWGAGPSPTIEYTYYLTQDTECAPKGYFADYKYSLK